MSLMLFQYVWNPGTVGSPLLSLYKHTARPGTVMKKHMYEHTGAMIWPDYNQVIKSTLTSLATEHKSSCVSDEGQTLIKFHCS